MVVPFLIFWILIAWCLYDGDLNPLEAAAFVGVWFALLLGFVLLRINPYWFVAPAALLDVILVLKVFGQDIKIR